LTWTCLQTYSQAGIGRWWFLMSGPRRRSL